MLCNIYLNIIIKFNDDDIGTITIIWVNTINCCSCETHKILALVGFFFWPW